MDEELKYKEECYKIIGCAMEVHRVLGPGFLESVYEKALTIEFQLQKVPFKNQVDIDVNYKNEDAGQFRADFLVYDKIIVEIKAVNNLAEIDKAQTINYIKATENKLGLLINFGEQSLKYQRFVNIQTNT